MIMKDTEKLLEYQQRVLDKNGRILRLLSIVPEIPAAQETGYRNMVWSFMTRYGKKLFNDTILL